MQSGVTSAFGRVVPAVASAHNRLGGNTPNVLVEVAELVQSYGG